jgi:hypothetical protein
VLLPVQTGVLERGDHEVAYGEVAAGGQHEVIRLVGLQHPPHALDVLGRVAPVADGVEVAEVDVVLQAGLDTGDRAGDLASHEGLAAAGGLVVEEDAVDGEGAVALAIVLGHPVGVDLGRTVGRTRVERRLLILRRRRRAEHLRARGLVVAAVDASQANRLEETHGTDPGGVTRVLRLVEADPDV